MNEQDVSEIATKYVQTARTLVSVAITHLKDEKDQEGSNALREKVREQNTLSSPLSPIR